MHEKAEEFIQALGLERHPEGGWFRETYRSTEMAPYAALPPRFSGDRSFCTAIYFLLKKGEFSAFHRIKSDELWHFHIGARITIHVITPEGDYWTLPLGADLSAGESFQTVVPVGCWFAAEVTGEGEYALVGCTVAPGFDFADFEMADRQSMMQKFPAYEILIQRLTVK